ncbi:hypothetical protein [Aquabacterium sp.]|uniref:hypothetical protein n=1 Tax=Aquabacterium sp. TaxID=1872578 RepID=UPI002488F37B|nr:hypothetical protein [Aquabacterium sp.]MDI1349210.1 hypothetical protein [Aquabacterium sp.]
MASFCKRGDHQWEAKIRKAGFPQLARTFESKSDAMAWAAEVEAEMRRGTFVSRALAERKTLGALIGQYAQPGAGRAQAQGEKARVTAA